MQPDYAKAYVGLADAYASLQYFGYVSPKSVRSFEEEAIRKSLYYDNELAEAHTILAVSKQDIWDWSTANSEYRHAIGLDAACVNAHFLYADHLLTQGKLAEAVIENTITQRLDPLNQEMKIHSAQILYAAKEYDRALAVCRKAEDMDRTNWFAHEVASDILFVLGHRAEAVGEMEVAARLDTHSIAVPKLGRMYALLGRTEASRRILQQLLSRSQMEYVPSHYVAWVYEGLGDFANADVWMRRAVQDRQPYLSNLKCFADKCNRANPFFPEWLKRVGLDN